MHDCPSCLFMGRSGEFQGFSVLHGGGGAVVQPLTLMFAADHSGRSVRLRDAQSGCSRI